MKYSCYIIERTVINYQVRIELQANNIQPPATGLNLPNMENFIDFIFAYQVHYQTALLKVKCDSTDSVKNLCSTL